MKYVSICTAHLLVSLICTVSASSATTSGMPLPLMLAGVHGAAHKTTAAILPSMRQETVSTPTAIST